MQSQASAKAPGNTKNTHPYTHTLPHLQEHSRHICKNIEHSCSVAYTSEISTLNLNLRNVKKAYFFFFSNARTFALHTERIHSNIKQCKCVFTLKRVNANDTASLRRACMKQLVPLRKDEKEKKKKKLHGWESVNRAT